MSSCSAPASLIAVVLGGSPRIIAALLPFVLAVGGAGCAHMPPPTPPPTAATSPAAAPGSDGAPEPTASAGHAARSAPGERDPSEEMSAEELASIPDPIPGVQRPPSSSPQGGDEGAREARSPDDEGSPPGTAVWRVQVLATPDRALADRVAREAGTRLGTVADVEYESSLYKVRLGRFDSEGDAGGLRDRAVELGYSGAFRVKKMTAATDE